MRISKSAIAAAVTAALPVLSLVGASDAGAASTLAPGKAADSHTTPRFRYPMHSRSNADAVLYDQSGSADALLTSQDFQPGQDSYDSEGADDFVVSDAAGWTISGFNFQAEFIGTNGPEAPPPTTTYDLTVFDDAAGLPGATAICTYSGISGVFDLAAQSLSLALPSPCELSAGTYWVSMRSAVDFPPQALWALHYGPPVNSEGAWRNPGDAFFTGCTTWGAASTCVGAGQSTNFLFQVVGTVGISTNCTPSGICLDSTVGTDLSPGACGTVDAVDATVGDQLNFCYTITNNTGVELDYQSLANNIDGALFTLMNQPLLPGDTFQYNHIATVSTTNTYNSTWTAQDVPPGYAPEVTGGNSCADRIFADGFGDAPTPCGGFIDVSGTGTPLGLSDDASADVTMPFSFNFFGTTSNLLSVSNNGGIVFGASGAILGFGNLSLPAASLPGPAILPLWDDFDSSSGDVYTDVRGSTPDRQFIVEWYNRAHFLQNIDPATFEVIFNESDGTLQFEYADVTYTGANNFGGDPDICDGGVCATIGLQNDPTLFNQFSAFQTAVTDNSGIAWTPTSPQVFTSTDSVTVNVGAPQIVVNPASITGSVAPGGATTIPFSIENHGNRDLDWSLTEAAPSTFHFAPPGARFAMPMGDPSKSAVGRAPLAGTHVPRKPLAGAAGHQPLAGVTAFAANAIEDMFETFDVTTDNGTNIVAAAQGTAFAFKFLDADFSKAYGIDKFGSMSGTFATVSSTDGTITPIGTPVAIADADGWTGFAQDPTTGTLYASAATCGSSSHLYTIDRNTGDATLVGEMTGMGCAIWIAIGPDGLMYSVDIINDALFAVDKTNGATSLKGSVGFNANYGQDADFDQSTGVLYWAAFNADTGEDEIRTVDLDTGATSLVYSFGFTQVTGLATETFGGPCFLPQDLPWLSLDTLTGSTPPLGASDIVASIDAANANDGDVLAGTVCATSNDPTQHIVGTPITVDVANPPPVPPTVTKAFNPSSVPVGNPSTLTITLANTNNVDATLTASLTDTFPIGLVIAVTPNAFTDCGGTLTAIPAAGSITLDSAGSAIPAQASCTITVDVTAALPNDYPNDIPANALQTDAGTNAIAADATLSVTP